MSVWQWITASFQNGELFFYVIPAFFVVLFIIVISVKSTAKKQDSEAQEEDQEPPEQEPHHELSSETDEKITASTESDIQDESEKKEELPAEGESLSESAGIAAEPSFSRPEPVPAPKTWSEGLEKTRGGFMARLKKLFSASAVTDELIEEMEEILYTADIGTPTVTYLLDEIEKNKKDFRSGEDVRLFLKDRITTILLNVEKEFSPADEKPFILLMTGVNGAGKTTTIGKLAMKYTSEGRKVILAAGDTFRAAAVEQLAEWGNRTGSEVISDREGADPASVAYNAVASAGAKNADMVIIDTAGRLQNRVNLMEELKKVHRVIGKAKEGAPHGTFLILDANNGQNALSQAREFTQAVSVTGIIITKLDGTAKGGVVIGIARELGIPVYFTGIGEKVSDLKPFNAREFVEALFA